MFPDRQIVVTDTTLRDGSHAVAHQFTREQVRDVARGLDRVGVPLVEISHGDGLAGSSINYGFSLVPEQELLETARPELQQAQLTVLLLPGIGTRADLQMARRLGATVARIATHCTEADISQQHIELAKQMGMTVVGFLMMAHMIEARELARQAKLMESYGADVVYVVDSAGALEMDGTRERVRALRDALQCHVGMHAHANLGLGVANSITAVREGATWIDGCCGGLGGGAGNTPTEIIVAVLDKLGYQTGIDVFGLMDVVEEIVRPIMVRPQIVDRDGLMLGYAGVYSSFLLHARRAAERFNVPVRDILLELGQRRVVGGQEDMIVDVAYEIQQRQLAAAKG